MTTTVPAAVRSATSRARAADVTGPVPPPLPGAQPADENPGDHLSHRQQLRLILLLGSLIAVAPLTIDMYLPALPGIGTDLRASSAAVQLTLTGTLIGLAAGQLLVGPISDAVGRRVPLLAGLGLHVLASVLCALAPDIAFLGALRVLQGLGVAAALVVTIAIVRDLFSGVAFARIFSRLMLVMGVAPILAPTLGGALLRWTDWRGVFIALAGFGLVLAAVASYGIRETLPPARRRPAQIGATLRTYAGLLTDRGFVGLVLVAGFAMAALFAYVGGSSFVFQDQYGLSEQEFAVAFGLGSLGLIAASQVNVRLLRRWSPQQILAAALAAGALGGAALVLAAVTGVAGLAGVLPPLWVVLASAGLVLPNAPALAMSRHGEAAGTAGAVLGAAQFGLGALLAPLVGVLGGGSLAMGSVIAGATLAAAVAMLVVVGRPAPGLPATTRAAEQS